MSRYARYLLLCLLLYSSHRSAARVSEVESNLGLPDKHITAICKDNRGLMWIGTRQGLCMYDGYRFIPLKGPLQQGTNVIKLCYNPLLDLLWVATDRGLFQVRCNALAISQKRNEGVTDVCLGSSYQLYAAFKNGRIAKLDTGGKAQSIYQMPTENGRQDFARHIMPDSPETLLVQSDSHGTFYRLFPGRNNAWQLTPIAPFPSAQFVKVTAGERLVYHADQIDILDDSSGKARYPAAQPLLQRLYNIVDLSLLPTGVLYALGRPSVLHRIDLVRNRRDTIRSDVFTGRTFNCFYFDPYGVTWVGTNKGLIRVTEDKRLFRQMLIQQPPASVRAIAEDELGNLYSGTYSGLYRSSDLGSNWAYLGDQIVYRLLNIPGNYLYFAGGDSSLYRINKRTQRIETQFWNKGFPGRSEIGEAYAIANADDGAIWLGSTHGLYIYSPASNDLAAWTGNGKLPVNTYVTFIKRADNGRLWVCTNHGLYELDAGGKIAAHFSTSTQPALSVDRLEYADEDATGRLWICTVGGGINIISRDRKQVSTLRTEDGLSDNETYHVLWQTAERAWISTFNGLSSYDLKTGTFFNYYTTDGLTTNEFNHSAFLQDKNGQMYFGSINGINVFYPDSITNAKPTARLFASDITKWDNASGAFVALPPADTLATIVLHPLDHSLSFSFGLTDYSMPESNKFMYRLPGVFDEWVKLEGQQALRLDGLAPGTYTLEIMALDGRGRPALNRLRYHIKVGQAFYKSWWLYLLLFVLASGLLWAFFSLRLQHVKRVQRLREQIASDLHDDVGSLLTRITMTSDNLRFSRNTEPERIGKLEKIALLSRSAASSMSDILWAIDARNDYTGNLADRMREHAEEMLLPLETELDFDFNVNQRMSISSQLRQQLYLIFKEAINNIAKHSQATEVTVSYHHNERAFLLRIVNNGYEPKEKSSAKSQGLKNISMRASRIHATASATGRDGRFEILVRGR